MPKRRIKLTVAYDGTRYCGWQIQKNGITVEEVLNRTLSKFFKEENNIDKITGILGTILL